MNNSVKDTHNQPLEKAYSDLKKEHAQQALELAQLKDRLAWMERQMFGQKREKFIPSNPAQSQLFEDSVVTNSTTTESAVTTILTHQRKKRKAEENRQPLPATLPRVEEILQPSFDTSGMRKIGEERTELLAYKPAELYVRVIIRPKYVKDDTFTIADLPNLPIPQGNADASLLTHLIISKYVEHLPLYRLSKRFARQGVELSLSTLSDWVAKGANLLEPLYDLMWNQVVETGYLQCDETALKVLDKAKKGKTHRGFFWVYYSPVYQLLYFDYQKGRGREGPVEKLKSFTGYLQVDGYQVYQYFERRKDIQLLNCMAHARRKFEQALSNDKARATYALQEIGKLYALER